MSGLEYAFLIASAGGSVDDSRGTDYVITHPNTQDEKWAEQD